ncbi:ATP-binding protein [Halanaerobium kushneri]|uniref:MinD superfamily P-loop ATPase, contains an inserted ferredoxin domain n=1 Tax=Halanaerobium kushneri TaxID=56779 RepID=A0A1N7AJZ5_9FIRM|nr:ATP-binding protein [Halanaerobium kushneri]SIR39460.1 MinD superfamily P-loop ATPase, contains an inserted ferredoxin domain [Halanaerobium kushneri]
MKEITVISGKGGTGKTTFTANLASILDNLVVGDCDVDAPNLHLLLNPRNKSEAVFKGMKLAVKNDDLCIDCGLCYENCRFNAITADNYQIKNLKCEGCAVCSYVCPTDAIRMEEIETGTLYEAESNYGEMVHAKLIPGADTSGKLVSEVKNRASEIAKTKNKDWILVDGSPGIGCPVIASLTGSDMAVLVTEPTLSGFADLKRVMEVVNHFKIQAGIVINKFDLNSNITAKIEAFAEEEKIELLTKIPYSRVIVDSLKKGELFVDNDQELRTKMLTVKEKLTKILER